MLREAPKIKRLFNELADLMLEADRFQKSHPNLSKTEKSKEFVVSEILHKELIRIIENIDGGPAIIEDCQASAVNRLKIVNVHLSELPQTRSEEVSAENFIHQ